MYARTQSMCLVAVANQIAAGRYQYIWSLCRTCVISDFKSPHGLPEASFCVVLVVWDTEASATQRLHNFRGCHLSAGEYIKINGIMLNST